MYILHKHTHTVRKLKEVDEEAAAAPAPPPLFVSLSILSTHDTSLPCVRACVCVWSWTPRSEAADSDHQGLIISFFFSFVFSLFYLHFMPSFLLSPPLSPSLLLIPPLVIFSSLKHLNQASLN